MEIITMDIDCSSLDSLEIRDGDSAHSPIIGSFCGSDKNILPFIATTQRHLWLRFTSNFEGTGNGFKIGYRSTDVSQSSFNHGSCGGDFKTQSGLITSPSYPNSYPAAKDCLYLVSVPYGFIISIRLISVDTNCHSTGSDYLEMRDGKSMSSPLMVKFCGNSSNIPGFLQTTQNHLWIRWGEMKT